MEIIFIITFNKIVGRLMKWKFVTSLECLKCICNKSDELISLTFRFESILSCNEGEKYFVLCENMC